MNRFQRSSIPCFSSLLGLQALLPWPWQKSKGLSTAAQGLLTSWPCSFIFCWSVSQCASLSGDGHDKIITVQAY